VKTRELFEEAHHVICPGDPPHAIQLVVGKNYEFIILFVEFLLIFLRRCLKPQFLSQYSQ